MASEAHNIPLACDDIWDIVFKTVVLFACGSLEDWCKIRPACSVWGARLMHMKNDMRGALLVYATRFRKVAQHVERGSSMIMYSLQVDGILLRTQLWRREERADGTIYIFRFGDTLKFQYFHFHTLRFPHASQVHWGFYVAYDPAFRFAIMCYGSEQAQGMGFHGERFQIPMQDGTQIVLKGPYPIDAYSFNGSCDVRDGLRLHNTETTQLRMLYLTDKYMKYLRDTHPEIWPRCARGDRVGVVRPLFSAVWSNLWRGSFKRKKH